MRRRKQCLSIVAIVLVAGCHGRGAEDQADNSFTVVDVREHGPVAPLSEAPSRGSEAPLPGVPVNAPRYDPDRPAFAPGALPDERAHR